MGVLSFDIFCRVVDNLGDIGVCWRLARQLAQPPHRHAVRLWVDDLHSFSRIAPQLRTWDVSQRIYDVDIVHWTGHSPIVQPHAVVIEAFACDPPRSFIDAMSEQGSLWINLEYLSAENWVESFHGLPSLQPNGLRKYFFFPGFTPNTGGLLREPGLLAARDQWLADPQQRVDFLKSVNVPDEQLRRIEQGARLVFLFCYPDAPAKALVDGLIREEHPTLLLIPQGVYPSLAGHQNRYVHIHQVPFVDQTNFDLLLWSSDLNFVRGEDSLVRALWAGKPFVWQIYAQEAGAHMIKLQAWLDLSGYPAGVQALMRQWNLGDELAVSTEITAALEPRSWKQWQDSCKEFTEKLAEYTDLAYCLVDFCTQKQRSG
ncbi:elongation factor P maturation arginine rhamnosyltransferase EarP [Pollutimonas nitritireducens]|uniref:Protein-arginine rhamnosyltransferase n=1 Tax=Pollutimonas nitritireducens TaxID=2045209 RepID=A0A2N4UJJ5_9BURK|nr:elongation factor P maturation arginine rhamnosyltransferase EarP [Pollutimonas nitritireducens]PLC55197.1 elongation factor P maturation arginine rhamnosyltransferase EarP [Pollutimonas nitritireducens]